MLNNEQASETFLEYRSLLFSIAYSMLGNVDAAEDIVQDTFLRWMEKPVTDVKHRKAYLVKMVTNKSINYLPVHNANPMWAYGCLNRCGRVMWKHLTKK